MRKFLEQIVGAMLLLWASPTLAGQARIAAGGLAFDFNLAQGTISNVGTSCSRLESRGPGGLYFIDGSTRTFHVPKEIRIVESRPGRIRYRLLADMQDLEVVASLSWTGRAVRWTVEIANHAAQAGAGHVVGLPAQSAPR